nr:hypothetical protein [Verrucomicrobiota bacterium]
PGGGSSGTVAAQQYTPGGEEAAERGSRDVSSERGAFAGLPPRDRAAIEQGQAEKYPEEYGPLVEQYLRNLAESSRK